MMKIEKIIINQKFELSRGNAKFLKLLKGVSYISFTFWIDSKCRWIDKKVFVGSDDPKWKIFLDGPIFNCPGLTQNFGFFFKIFLQFFIYSSDIEYD